jgi:hypothetical protein
MLVAFPEKDVTVLFAECKTKQVRAEKGRKLAFGKPREAVDWLECRGGARRARRGATGCHTRLADFVIACEWMFGEGFDGGSLASTAEIHGRVLRGEKRKCDARPGPPSLYPLPLICIP